MKTAAVVVLTCVVVWTVSIATILVVLGCIDRVTRWLQVRAEIREAHRVLALMQEQNVSIDEALGLLKN